MTTPNTSTLVAHSLKSCALVRTLFGEAFQDVASALARVGFEVGPACAMTFSERTSEVCGYSLATVTDPASGYQAELKLRLVSSFEIASVVSNGTCTLIAMVDGETPSKRRGRMRTMDTLAIQKLMHVEFRNRRYPAQASRDTIFQGLSTLKAERRLPESVAVLDEFAAKLCARVSP